MDRIGDPHFVAVYTVAFVSLARGDGADSLQIGAGVGLCEGDAAAQLAGGKARQVAFFLRLRAMPFDCSGHDKMRVDDAADRHPGSRDLFDDLGVGRGR